MARPKKSEVKVLDQEDDWSAENKKLQAENETLKAPKVKKPDGTLYQRKNEDGTVSDKYVNEQNKVLVDRAVEQGFVKV